MIRIENNLLKFDKEDIYINPKTNLPKKITGHSFVALIGKDNFKKRGDTILELFKLIPLEKIDVFYTKRGELGEYLIKKMYEKQQVDYKTWNAKDINFDNFSEVSKYFGGLVDGLLNEDTIIEIKTKSLDKFDYIKNNAIESEEYQAKLYATLWDKEKIKMQYVFFDEETERQLKANETITNLKGCKRLEKDINSDKEIIKQFMELALRYYVSCLQTLSIPLEDISPYYLKKLNLQGEN